MYSEGRLLKRVSNLASTVSVVATVPTLGGSGDWERITVAGSWWGNVVYGRDGMCVL